MEIGTQLERLIEIFPFSVYWKDKEGVYLGCNEFMTKMAGVSSSKEVIGKTDYNLPWHEDADVLRKIDVEVMKTGKPVTTEETGILASGKRGVYLTIKTPLIDNTTTKIMGIFGLSIDITSRKRIEKKLKNEKRKILAADRDQMNKIIGLSQKITGYVLAENATTEEYALHMLDYLENIIACMPGSVYWKDRNGIYRGGNDYLAKMAGFKSRKEIVGKTDYDFAKSFNWDSEFLESVMSLDSRVMETGIAQFNHEEKPFRIANSQYIIQLSSKVPLFNHSNKAIGVVGISIDITERKKMEEALRDAKIAAEAANRAKSVFIANMSHDIRTPLSGIIGMSEMLEKEGANPQDREFGHVIHYSSERLLSLLNDILEVISAGETQEGHLQIETFNLFERIQHVKELFATNIQMKHIKFEVSTDPQLPQYVVSDRIKIDRTLLNLIGNALKFTKEGSIGLHVTLVSHVNDQALIEFKVSDTGIGIHKDDIDKIFDRFYKVSLSYENKHKGYGIGLFIVKQFVSLLGGEIKIKSKLGSGTTFTIMLPMKIGRKEDSKETAYDVQTSSEPSTQNTVQVVSPSSSMEEKPLKKALLIEDDAIARRTAQYMLESAGFEVQAVASGEDGFTLANTETFDLVITDIGLPGIDGNELALLIRNREKKSKKPPLPIIGLSAHVESSYQKEALDAGMDLLLQKPLNDAKIASFMHLFSGEAKELASDTKDKTETTSSSLGLDLPNTEDELFELAKFPILDEKLGVEITGSNEFFREMLSVLIRESIPIELANLEQAYQDNDWNAVQSMAHKLKSSALYCGTVRMRYACQYMERYRLAGHHKLLEALYQQLVAVSKETQDIVSHHLEIL